VQPNLLPRQGQSSAAPAAEIARRIHYPGQQSYPGLGTKIPNRDYTLRFFFRACSTASSPWSEFFLSPLGRLILAHSDRRELWERIKQQFRARRATQIHDVFI